MIVWLASYPRSGNTLFRMATKAAFDTGTYSVYGANEFRPEIAALTGLRVPMKSVEQMRADEEVFFIKTHELPDTISPADSAILLVRDGRDATVSYAKYLEMVVAEDDTSLWTTAMSRGPGRVRHVVKKLLGRYRRSTSLMLGSILMGRWRRHTDAWLQHPATRAVVRFEDLKEDPIRVAVRAVHAAGFVGDPKSDASLPGFDELHDASPQFFRRGESGGWTSEMPAPIERLFWLVSGATMRKLGYTRQPA